MTFEGHGKSCEALVEIISSAWTDIILPDSTASLISKHFVTAARADAGKGEDEVQFKNSCIIRPIFVMVEVEKMPTVSLGHSQERSLTGWSTESVIDTETEKKTNIKHESKVKLTLIQMKTPKH